MKFITLLVLFALVVIHRLAAYAWTRDTGLGYWDFWGAGLEVWWQYHLPRLLVTGITVVVALVLRKLIWK